MTGHRSFKELTKTHSRSRKARVANKVAALESALALYELRKTRKVSQQTLAQKLSVGQPAVAKLERRPDMYVGNLCRYVEALGGTLEITARFPDGTVTVTDIGAMKSQKDRKAG